MSSSVRIKDLPWQDRPRERLVRHGAESLGNVDLIAILLRTGTKGLSAIHIAEKLLQHFGSLRHLAGASLEDLAAVKGIGRAKAIALTSAFTLAKRMAHEFQSESPVLDTPESIAQILRDENRSREVEYFQIILLNARRRLIRVNEVTRGTIDSSLVHPREVFRSAIQCNAAAVVLAHNHPSGDPTPSDSDIKVTRDLIRAGHILKIEVVDHVIFGHPTATRSKDYVSLKELGYFHS